MYDRLPLYIVALYPAMMMLAYETVRSFGVFRDRGPLIGAVCVGFVHQCYYEDLRPTRPTTAVVGVEHRQRDQPSDARLGADEQRAALRNSWTGTGRTLHADPCSPTAHARTSDKVQRHLVLRTFGVAMLIPIGLAIANLPILLAGSGHPDGPLRWGVYLLFLAAFAVVALPVLLRQWRTAAPMPDIPNPFVRIFGSAFLVVIGALWLTAFPAYLNASDGITADGTPTGNGVYAAVCFLLASAMALSVSIRAPIHTVPRSHHRPRHS